jgi:SAM-dependent methyltransferase
MTTDRINVKPYINLLRDPMGGGDLVLQGEGGDQALLAPATGQRYEFVGAFPDLRPPQDRPQKTAVDQVRDHYHDTPCYNYLDLDNVPLGKYLRDPGYESYFQDVGFMVEVGAGRGAIAQAVKDHRGITPFCVDLAYGSLMHVRRPALEADGCLGSNLSLPLKDGVADLVFSYGVIHHTPNPTKCLRELSRILKPGGRLLLGVYNWENLYRKLYHFFNPPLGGLRQMGKPGDLLLKYLAFPPYHFALWLVLGLVQGKWSVPDWSTSWEQFGDFFLTPIARFYHQEELVTMGDAFGLEVLEMETGGWPRGGFAHFVWYRKRL